MNNQKKTGILAILALIFGLVALLFEIFGFFSTLLFALSLICAIAAIIIGIVALCLKTKIALPIIGIVISAVTIFSSVTVIALKGTVFLTKKALSKADEIINSPKELPLEEQVLQYMEQKYGEKFEYVKNLPGDGFEGLRFYLVTCESLDEEILVRIEKSWSENKVFSDNYLAIKYKQDMINFLQENANANFNEANVFYDVSGVDSLVTLNPDVTFEEYLRDLQPPINISVEIKESNYHSTNQVKDFSQSLNDTGLDYYLSVLVLEDNEYGISNREELWKKRVNNQYQYCFLIANTSTSKYSVMDSYNSPEENLEWN